MLKHSRAASLGLAFVICACSAAARAPVRPPASPLDGPIVVVHEEAGERALLWGGTRAVSAREQVRVAADSLPTLLWATRIADGWLFLSQNGELFRSQTFTGDARRLGSIAGPYRPLRSSRGRLAVVDEIGSLWLSVGTQPPKRARLPAPGRALVAVFRDVRVGFAVLEAGQLAATSDGGETWRPVSLPDGEAAWDVERDGDQIRVETTAGPYVADATGALRAVDTDLAAGPAPPTAAEVTQLQRALGRRPAPTVRPEETLLRPPSATFRTISYLCKSSGASTALPLPAAKPDGSDARLISLIGPGARTQLATWRKDGRWFAHAAWSGDDQHGSFSGESSATLLPLPVSDAAAGQWFLEGAWRGGVLLRRCADDQPCTRWTARDDASLIAVSIARNEGAASALLPLGRAGALLLFQRSQILIARQPDQSRREHPSMRERLLGIDSVWFLDANGSARKRSFVRVDVDAPAALAQRGERAGYAVAEGNDMRALRFYPLYPANAATIDLPMATEQSLAPCGQARAGATELVGVRFEEFVRAGAPLVIAPQVRAVLEISQELTCLRSFETPAETAPGGEYGVRAVASDAGFAGFFDEDQRRWPLRCIPSTAPGD